MYHDYNNLIAAATGATIIVLCVVVYCLAQIYFKGCGNKSQQKNGQNKNP